MIKIISLVSALCVLASTSVAQVAASSGNGAVLRVLDKVSGQSTNYDVATGRSIQIGKLSVALRACRYPKGAINNDAFAFLDVSETETAENIFNGWMIASAPALNAMEHSRYDVWVLRCTTS